MPSVILANLSGRALVALLVTGLPSATLVTPGGTIKGGRGLPVGFSTSGEAGVSEGVPMKAAAGSLICKGTRSSALQLKIKPKQASPATSRAWPGKLDAPFFNALISNIELINKLKIQKTHEKIRPRGLPS
jgi:hypothetical protein